MKTRSIISLRNPHVILLPAFAHVAAFDCADIIKTSIAAHVVPQCMQSVDLPNKSTNKWLPCVREFMMKADRRQFALKASVVTRWKSVWICACSLLSAIADFRPLIASLPATIVCITTSNDKRLKALQDVLSTISSDAFWKYLEEYMLLLVPSIESGLLPQGGDATLADVVYCRCRQYIRLFDADKHRAVKILERIWRQIEQSLML